MSENQEPEAVVFRMWQGDVIALFSAVAADTQGHCLSYQHVGQHSGADYAAIIADSRPARPEEYATLKAELETIGYSLKVYRRATPQQRAQRRAGRC